MQNRRGKLDYFHMMRKEYSFKIYMFTLKKK